MLGLHWLLHLLLLWLYSGVPGGVDDGNLHSLWTRIVNLLARWTLAVLLITRRKWTAADYGKDLFVVRLKLEDGATDEQDNH